MLSLNTSHSESPFSFSGLRLLLEEVRTVPKTELESLPETCLTSPLTTPLHRHLTALCLHNPYWNDFRIINHFQKRGIKMTLKKLDQLKKECCLDDREIICNTLIHLSTHGGLHLNPRQISYIERAKPEFRDRDLQPSTPGELFVYRRLFGRGVGDFGRVYLHIFIDMYTGRTFGKLSQSRSVNTGLEHLQSTMLPIYKSRHYTLNTILHSTQDTHDLNEFNQLDARSRFSSLGLQWLPTHRTFGAYEKFERYLTQNCFFDAPPVWFPDFEIAFERQLAKYNARNRWFARRTLLDY